MGKIGVISASVTTAIFGLLVIAANDVKAQQQGGYGETTYFGTEGETLGQRLGQRFGAQNVQRQQYSQYDLGYMGQMMQPQQQFGQPQYSQPHQFGQTGAYGQQQPQQFGQTGWGQQEPPQFGQQGGWGQQGFAPQHGRRLMAIQHLRQSLQQAGLSNIRLVDAAFLISAQTPAGETVAMIVNPPGGIGAFGIVGLQQQSPAGQFAQVPEGSETPQAQAKPQQFGQLGAEPDDEPQGEQQQAEQSDIEEDDEDDES